MPRSRFLLFSIIAAVSVAQATVEAQVSIPRGQPVRPGIDPYAAGRYEQPGMRALDPDKKLAPGDEVTLEVVQDREGGVPRVVTATGELDVPPGVRVKVAGKTSAEAEQDIRRALEKDYYYKATVRLSIDRAARGDVNIGTVLLSGEVRMVGPLNMISGESLTVSQAILKAGGFKEFADDRKVQVTRMEGGKVVRRTVDVKDILRTGETAKDMSLQDGDRVNVPRVGFKF